MKFWPFSKHEMLQIGIIIVCVCCIGFIAYIVVKSHGERLCQGGCGINVKPSSAHFTLCINCKAERVWDCVNHKPDKHKQHHRVECEKCGKWYYICDKSSASRLTIEELSEGHRIVGKGTPDEHYACKPEDTLSVPIPDK